MEADDEFFEILELNFNFKLQKVDMNPAQRDPDSFPMWDFRWRTLTASWMVGVSSLIHFTNSIPGVSITLKS